MATIQKEFRRKIVKNGSSLAVNIPNELIKVFGLRLGKEYKFTVEVSQEV